MKTSFSLWVPLALFSFLSSVSAEEFTLHAFEKVQLSDRFYAEGANFGDFNNDGVMDIVSGPFWYEGPDFGVRHEIYPPKVFPLREFSDCFLVFVHDIDRDGWSDVVAIGFPGAAAHWFRNPGRTDRHWERHLIYHAVGNESPVLADLVGDERPELIFNTDQALGYAQPDPEDPTAPWTFVGVSAEGNWGRFTHGLGYGDVNGDGRMDLITEHGWWEQPESLAGDPAWTFHPVTIGPGAQMYVYDFDGDGRQDLASTLHAHGWGVGWFRQVPSDGGGIAFERHLLTGERYRDSRYGVRFSQPHAMALADVDGDGVKDLVTGKRFWGHGPDGDPEPNAPGVLYWFKTSRAEDGGVDFLPFRIDENSGVGTQVVARDITGDGYPEIVVANKRGLFFFRNEPVEVSREVWEAAQPKVIPYHLP